MEGTDLVAEQAARLTAIDPLLPAMTEPPDGETLVATLPDGGRVTGVLRVTFTDRGAPEFLWSALEVWQLTPIIGTRGTEGMDAILRACRARLDRESQGPDSSCLVAWPSRDAEATRALLDHGLVPLSALAVRTGTEPPAPGPAGVTVRRATPADLAAILRLELAEIEYSAHVGSLRARPSAAERDARKAALRDRLAEDTERGGQAMVWLAEAGGEPAGFAEAGWTDVEEGSWLGEEGAGPDQGASLSAVLPAGRWGYVSSTAVRPGARGHGVGRALLAVIHGALAGVGVRGTYLYYNPPNPLASVFWHRQGYRPLWTVWEVRPASALR